MWVCQGGGDAVILRELSDIEGQRDAEKAKGVAEGEDSDFDDPCHGVHFARSSRIKKGVQFMNAFFKFL